MQEIPIPDGNFLDVEANTYPGELTKASPKKILHGAFCQPSSAAWIAILVMWRTRPRSSPVSRDSINHKPGFDKSLNLKNYIFHLSDCDLDFHIATHQGVS